MRHQQGESVDAIAAAFEYDLKTLNASRDIVLIISPEYNGGVTPLVADVSSAGTVSGHTPV